MTHTLNNNFTMVYLHNTIGLDKAVTFFHKPLWEKKRNGNLHLVIKTHNNKTVRFIECQN